MLSMSNIQFSLVSSTDYSRFNYQTLILPHYSDKLLEEYSSWINEAELGSSIFRKFDFH